jgi:hypothetical protein
MERKNRYLLMVLFKELKKVGWKLLSMQVDKKIFFTQMVQELENTLMEE